MFSITFSTYILIQLSLEYADESLIRNKSTLVVAIALCQQTMTWCPPAIWKGNLQNADHLVQRSMY